jgi:hypothetical protein
MIIVHDEPKGMTEETVVTYFKAVCLYSLEGLRKLTKNLYQDCCSFNQAPSEHELHVSVLCHPSQLKISLNRNCSCNKINNLLNLYFSKYTHVITQLFFWLY